MTKDDNQPPIAKPPWYVQCTHSCVPLTTGMAQLSHRQRIKPLRRPRRPGEDKTNKDVGKGGREIGGGQVGYIIV